MSDLLLWAFWLGRVHGSVCFARVSGILYFLNWKSSQIIRIKIFSKLLPLVTLEWDKSYVLLPSLLARTIIEWFFSDLKKWKGKVTQSVWVELPQEVER